MLYVLLFRQNFLGRLTLLILLVILVFHIEINLFSDKRTPSNNSNYKVRVFLSSKRKKNSNQGKKDGNAHQADEIRD